MARGAGNMRSKQMVSPSSTYTSTRVRGDAYELLYECTPLYKLSTLWIISRLRLAVGLVISAIDGIIIRDLREQGPFAVAAEIGILGYVVRTALY